MCETTIDSIVDGLDGQMTIRSTILFLGDVLAYAIDETNRDRSKSIKRSLSRFVHRPIQRIHSKRMDTSSALSQNSLEKGKRRDVDGNRTWRLF